MYAFEVKDEQDSNQDPSALSQTTKPLAKPAQKDTTGTLHNFFFKQTLTVHEYSTVKMDYLRNKEEEKNQSKQKQFNRNIVPHFHIN